MVPDSLSKEEEESGTVASTAVWYGENVTCITSLSCFLLYLQSAVGWDYQAELSKHESQTDATKGFGGRYGVQKDRQDEVYIYTHLGQKTIL